MVSLILYVDWHNFVLKIISEEMVGFSIQVRPFYLRLNFEEVIIQNKMRGFKLPFDSIILYFEWTMASSETSGV